MPINSNEKQLKRCLEDTIKVIKNTITQFQPSAISELDTISINTFTLNLEDDEVMDELKIKIENLLNNHLPFLSKDFRNYLLNFLYEYDYDDKRREFKNCLSIGILHPFARGLQSLLTSMDALQAAWNGELTTVQRFINIYPSLKDKPGHLGTTLLYSAATNGHMPVVKYLIETAKCSVNAQNEQDLEKILSCTTTKTLDCTSGTKAASTALHGACFHGHFQIVQYLVEHGANYFIKNQALETPLMTIKSQDDKNAIKQYFRNYLLLGYLKTLNIFPDKPISEETKQIIDCIWEYKSFDDIEWHSFSNKESEELQQSLIEKSDQQFQPEIRFINSNDIYIISTVQFLRSTQNNNLAWIRCRGSSILNFDCYSIWQIMFLKHPKAELNSIASLKIFNIPTIDDLTFQIQIHSWYNCDTNTNCRFDNAMNYRQKLIQLDLDFISDESLLFNLQTFSFMNNKRTIIGFIRWIPKLISNSEQDKNKIINIENFSSMTNLIPIPLTTKRLQQFIQENNNSSLRDDELFDSENGDDGTSTGFSNDLDDDDNHFQSPNETNKSSDSSIWTINDIENDVEETATTDISHDNMEQEQDPIVTSATTDDNSVETTDVRIDDYLNPNTDNPHSSLSTKVVENQELIEEILENVRKEMKEIEVVLDEEKQKIRQSEIVEELQENSNETIKKTEKLNHELKKLAKKEEKIKQITDTIQTIQYTKIEKYIIHNFLIPKHEFILNHLKTQTKNFDDYFLNKIPKLTLEEKRNTYTIILTSIQTHHQSFQEILQRILTLSHVQQRAIEFYQQYLNRILKSLNEILFKVQSNTKYWKQYTQILYQLLKTENLQYLEKFKDFIGLKTKELIDLIILDDSISPWTLIRTEIDLFMKQTPFISVIEGLKHQALDTFIELNISVQQLKSVKKPTKDSINILQYFIGKIKKKFQEDPQYIGDQKEHFSRIPSLLQRLMIYYCCFIIQLPLYQSSKELLKEIKKNTVITISTSTGSGKSTLLPALLIAEGYDKVLVTQPGRLSCRLISKRINETMIIDRDRYAEKLAGWAVNGDEENSRAKILYLTAGLLKERLLNDVNFITNDTNVKKSIVLFIDEVHERSANIDLCLALIARMLTYNPALISKLKIIISSATLDSSISTLFSQIPNIKFKGFQIPSMNTLYPVTIIQRSNENILDIVKQIISKRQRQEQILCFVSSTSEVNRYCKLLKEISQNTIIAYPLIQSQSPREQEESIEKGSVFFSTTVAETSLTFSSLKYVVDTGTINVPIYDIHSKRTILTEEHAAESTIKQRLGRLGRTQSGEYYALYDSNLTRKPFPIPQICQSDLTTIEFSLRKSPLYTSLNHIKDFLPDKPTNEIILYSINELIDMDILKSDSSEQLTNYGKSLAKLPDFGSLPMARCVLAALLNYDCGGDLICLASVLNVLNTTSILKYLPQRFKSSDGDLMTLLNVINEILLIKQSIPARKFNFEYICEVKELGRVKNIIRQALKRYTILEKSFDLSDDYRIKAQIKSDNWKLIAKALLTGYSNNVFVSEKHLQKKTHHFLRYNATQDTVAILDSRSTLTRSINQSPVSLVLARDIFYLPATIRLPAIISFLGEIKVDWLEHRLERQIKLNDAEYDHLKDHRYSKIQSIFSKEDIEMDFKSNLITLTGKAGVVLRVEIYLLQELIIENKYNLDNQNSIQNENLSRNLENVMKMIQIFRPMIWRWKIQKQILIIIDSNTATKTCEIIIKGRDSQVQIVRQEFDSFSSWLQNCAVIRHPNAGVSPRPLLTQMRINCTDIEERISHITDYKRSPIDLYNNIKGSQATRETRMEVVAWIAVCLFDCKLEGRFVRDWIVGKYTSRPDNVDPNNWIIYHKTSNIPRIINEVIPADLDCHLPIDANFDSDKFQHELYKFGITCQIFRDDWRYIILVDLDTRTGPFTVDLIEPHAALTHDRIDFDINNLVLEKNYTHDLGMRIDIQQKPYSIELETIVDNIKNKCFQILHPIDDIFQQRMNKMTNIRQWKQIGQPFNIIPNPDPKYNAILILLHNSNILYQNLAQQMRLINNNLQIISIEEIKNSYLEEIFETMKKLIAKQSVRNNPNKHELFYGTSGDGIDGIVEYGFDDRFFNKDGLWGQGAYFSDDPRKSHSYTTADTANTRVMFYNKVLLGNEAILKNSDNSLVAAPEKYHSVRGTGREYTEYIIYRYGQVLPYLKIIYRV